LSSPIRLFTIHNCALYYFSTNSKYVGLIGDFNSITGEDDDYVNVNFKHGDNNIDEFIENRAGILENLNIPLKRDVQFG
jgi:hypothetical protein